MIFLPLKQLSSLTEDEQSGRDLRCDLDLILRADLIAANDAVKSAGANASIADGKKMTRIYRFVIAWATGTQRSGALACLTGLSPNADVGLLAVD